MPWSESTWPQQHITVSNRLGPQHLLLYSGPTHSYPYWLGTTILPFFHRSRLSAYQWLLFRMFSYDFHPLRLFRFCIYAFMLLVDYANVSFDSLKFSISAVLARDPKVRGPLLRGRGVEIFLLFVLLNLILSFFMFLSCSILHCLVC